MRITIRKFAPMGGVLFSAASAIDGAIKLARGDGGGLRSLAAAAQYAMPAIGYAIRGRENEYAVALNFANVVVGAITNSVLGNTGSDFYSMLPEVSAVQMATNAIEGFHVPSRISRAIKDRICYR